MGVSLRTINMPGDELSKRVAECELARFERNQRKRQDALGQQR